MMLVFPIVEGHGEVHAFPVLIRRILHERLFRFGCTIPLPYRLSRPKILEFGNDLAKVVRFAEGKISQHGQGSIIILVDADDDCPAEVQTMFQQFKEDRGFAVEIGLVLASREYEAWFISCAEHLRGRASVRAEVRSHPNPEAVRDAKGYFESQVLRDKLGYAETVDQEKFSAVIDLDCVHRVCRSFRKLQAEVDRLSQHAGL